MKTLKDNFIVKTVYAYLDLFYKVFPFLLIFFALPLILNPLLMPNDFKGGIGFFGDITGKLRGHELSTSTNILLIIANLAVVIGVYLSLKKLTTFMKNVFEENPFCEENGKHLKFVGQVVIVYVLIYHVLSVILIPMKDPLISPVTSILIGITNLLGVFFNGYFVLGLFFIVLGEIILNGANIKQENDLTV